MPPITAARAAAALALALFALAFSVSCGSDPEVVRFMAGFQAQANVPLVGVYAAEARGYFKDQGLQVEINHAEPGSPSATERLEAGEVDVVTATAPGMLGLISRRTRDSQPVSLVAIALFGQRGDRGWVARASSGIDGPEDFAGKRVGSKTSAPEPELRAMLASVGLSTDDMEIVKVGFDVSPFTNGEVDVFPVFLNNEPDTIRRAGVAINVIDPAMYDVPALGLVFMSTSETIEARPEAVTKFMRAVLQGIEWAEAHPSEAIDLVLRYAPDADPEHQRFLWEIDLANCANETGVGRTTMEQWQASIDLLRRYEAIPVPVDPAAVFYPALIESIYASGGP